MLSILCLRIYWARNAALHPCLNDRAFFAAGPRHNLRAGFMNNAAFIFSDYADFRFMHLLRLCQNFITQPQLRKHFLMVIRTSIAGTVFRREKSSYSFFVFEYIYIKLFHVIILPL